MEQHEIPISFNIINHLSRKKDNYPFYEVGQLRRTKMHAARLIDAANDRKNITLRSASATERKFYIP
ncbi:hypothetical protein [Nitrosomonas sp. Nm166]|uniref:hypothetical protein n=1 Tax=Nitrosomonas sp. Nm166 TaxID=1881054 RepID=UPI0008F18C2E|nr:hypothetical protein [Nitrosomonas sp. Nm166]SFF09549.1 hypothetical protein SAMN05428977_104918 [Nitrosomonas sp. Nm166]